MFGPGLRIIRPVSKIYGIKNLPFLFRSCSSYCRHLFLSSTDTLAEILYGSEDGFQAMEAPWIRTAKIFRTWSFVQSFNSMKAQNSIYSTHSNMYSFYGRKQSGLWWRYSIEGCLEYPNMFLFSKVKQGKSEIMGKYFFENRKLMGRTEWLSILFVALVIKLHLV